MENIFLRKAAWSDLTAVLQLQKRCYQSEAAIYNDDTIQPLIQTLEELHEEISQGMCCLVACQGQTIVGSVRGIIKGITGYINKLIVAPEYQNRGIGKQLMQEMEALLAPVAGYELFTGNKSLKNPALYQKLGYSAFREQPVNDGLTLVFLHKRSPEAVI
ncbi:GNAT family N-acetyltransferase [Niabella drilacis]|uniref:Acetyltransferase (GNAT) domain-containing protein n=1 Tax=Niabella drilacis (strain DSM 25811 / CCM 8410 / CCUG 62505 / LMG 26954 / E90) TaxID=1285928 RepID=A0A1G6S2X4_NIADE|nr:GNAT family N-acetyltransferase [Niabella drilacis]SDD11033.1 Acetyltransferase (GNAT) domain-containing protein [Niabella drilacis]